jgi:hypothetical protein
VPPASADPDASGSVPVSALIAGWLESAKDGRGLCWCCGLLLLFGIGTESQIDLLRVGHFVD